MTEGGDKQSKVSRWAFLLRMTGALVLSMAFGLGVYYLLQAARPEGVISYTFLLAVPAAVCAVIAFAADMGGALGTALGGPQAGRRSLGFYLLIPVWTLAAVIVISLFVLREGVICVILLCPLWVISGVCGTLLIYAVRKWLRKGRTYGLAILLLPLIVFQLEPFIPLSETTATVTRSIVVEASPEQIWPLLRGIPDVRPGEGQWNISQDVIGIPRPKGAQLVGEGIDANRLADWGHAISFSERITRWQPQSAISWRFIFDNMDGWAFTDRHLMPDSAYFKVTTGGYEMQRLGPNRTRVTLHTRYWMKTPVNGYCQLWGEFFLGDLETNLLALVKHRAEKTHGI